MHLVDYPFLSLLTIGFAGWQSPQHLMVHNLLQSMLVLGSSFPRGTWLYTVSALQSIKASQSNARLSSDDIFLLASWRTQFPTRPLSFQGESINVKHGGVLGLVKRGALEIKWKEFPQEVSWFVVEGLKSESLITTITLSLHWGYLNLKHVVANYLSHQIMRFIVRQRQPACKNNNLVRKSAEIVDATNHSQVHVHLLSRVRVRL